MCLPEVIPWVFRYGFDDWRWKVSPDIVVVKIDEEWSSTVTWGCMTRRRYMVYNMN
jgi:hypothetical protein